MTRIWMVSREVNKNMELLSAALSTAYAVELLKKGTPPDSLKKELNIGQQLLSLLEQATQSMLVRSAKLDITLFLIIKELQKNLEKTPKQLLTTLSQLRQQLEKGQVSKDLEEFLSALINAVITNTQREVDELSSLLMRT